MKIKVLHDIYWKIYEGGCSIRTIISPTSSTKYLYKKRFQKPLNLKNPESFNEKIQWLKLNTYNNNPTITQCADKYAVREFVKKMGCEELLIPLMGVYSDVNEIDWDSLPKKFVLKCNHGCGYNLICVDKEKLNIEKAKKTVSQWMKDDYWKHRAEINYKYIPKKITIEKFIDNNGKQIEDYKFYCFNGKVLYTMVCLERKEGHAKYYFFDRDWNLIPYSKDALKIDKNFKICKPQLLDKAIEYAEKLSAQFPFVRTDLYILDDKVYFGELTFTPAGGLDDDLLDGDKEMGKLIKLDL